MIDLNTDLETDEALTSSSGVVRGGGATKGVGSNRVHVIDPRRANNGGIILAGLKNMT